MKELIVEIERLTAELREKTLNLLKVIQQQRLAEDNWKKAGLLTDICVNADKIVRVADSLTVKCRKYLEKTGG